MTASDTWQWQIYRSSSSAASNSGSTWQCQIYRSSSSAASNSGSTWQSQIYRSSSSAASNSGSTWQCQIYRFSFLCSLQLRIHLAVPDIRILILFSLQLWLLLARSAKYTDPSSSSASKSGSTWQCQIYRSPILCSLQIRLHLAVPDICILILCSDMTEHLRGWRRSEQ